MDEESGLGAEELALLSEEESCDSSEDCDSSEAVGSLEDVSSEDKFSDNSSLEIWLNEEFSAFSFLHAASIAKGDKKLSANNSAVNFCIVFISISPVLKIRFFTCAFIVEVQFRGLLKRRQKTLFYFNTAFFKKSIVKNRKKRKHLSTKEKIGNKEIKILEKVVLQSKNGTVLKKRKDLAIHRLKKVLCCVIM